VLTILRSMNITRQSITNIDIGLMKPLEGK
jgi:hypothetical protein